MQQSFVGFLKAQPASEDYRSKRLGRKLTAVVGRENNCASQLQRGYSGS